MSEQKVNLVTVHKDTITSFPADINMEYVSNIIHQRENPHPLISIGLVVGVIIVLYLIYILFAKRCISGIWFGKLGEYPDSVKYKIQHNPFTDSLRVSVPNHGLVATGKIAGDTIWIHMRGLEMVGVLVSNSQIVWVNSKDVWNNVKMLN